MSKFFKRTVVFILILTLMVSTSIFASFAVNRKVTPAFTGKIDTKINPSGDEVFSLEKAERKEGRIVSTGAKLPSKYSSMDEGYVVNVKDQNKTNCCWAFAGTSALEIALKMKGEYVEPYSPLHLAYIQSLRDDNTGYLTRTNWLNSGGNGDISLGYLTSDKGAKESYLEDKDIIDIGNTHYITDESGNGMIDPVYEASVRKIAKQFDENHDRKAAVDSFFYVDTDSFDNVKSTIKEYGFVYGSMVLSVDYFDDIYLNYYCPDIEAARTSGGGHDILVIGWDDNYDKDNFKEECRPQNNGAWICLNSWGAEQTEGLIYISYEDTTLFSEEYGLSWTIDKAHVVKENEKLHSISETACSFGTSNPYGEEMDEVYYFNRFTFSQGETLKDVYFDTESVGAEYEICYVPVKDNMPDIENVVKLGVKGEVPYAGYIDVEIEDGYKLPAGDGFIGLSLAKKNGSKNSLSFTCDYTVETGQKIDYYKFKEIKEGTSFSGLNNEVYTQADDLSVLGQMYMIKARTVTDTPSPEEYFYGDANLSGKVTISDATVIQQYLAKITTFSDLQKELAKTIEGDKEVNINDATAIQMYLVNLEFKGSKVDQKYIKE